MIPLYRIPRLSVVALVAACSAGIGPAPVPVPGSPGSAAPTTATNGPVGQLPLTANIWPVRTREHVDLWLHSYALLASDTTLVPYFRRGYRDRMLALRRERSISTELDASRDQLLRRISANPSLATNGQFIPLYFGSWDEMRRAVDLFLRANGNPRAATDATQRTEIIVLAAAFPTPSDREFVRLLTQAADDESRRFYHDYWAAESRARVAISTHVDSAWQLHWRPALQRFLNNTQQQNGELFLSMPLGGEGRTIKYGKQQNAVAVPFPESRDESDVALYVMAHEIAGQVASAAIADNTTPAEQRSGTTSRYEQAGAVRAGALLLERTVPAVVPGYMRYYLQQAGRTAPNDPRSAFGAAFFVPTAVLDALARQLEVILGGI